MPDVKLALSDSATGSTGRVLPPEGVKVTERLTYGLAA